MDWFLAYCVRGDRMAPCYWEGVCDPCETFYRLRFSHCRISHLFGPVPLPWTISVPYFQVEVQLALSLPLPSTGLEALLHVGYNDEFAFPSSSVSGLLLPLYLWTVASAVPQLLGAEFGFADRTFVVLVKHSFPQWGCFSSLARRGRILRRILWLSWSEYWQFSLHFPPVHCSGLIRVSWFRVQLQTIWENCSAELYSGQLSPCSWFGIPCAANCFFSLLLITVPVLLYSSSTLK